MPDPSTIRQIKERLRYSWGPFFVRFGNLTKVQQMAIPVILDGKNLVLASPTASGKTEAVVAPTAERFIKENWKGLAILYIVPTRALANDTLSRIEAPLSEMGIKTELKHGDHPTLRGKLPNCLITTPESLDSLLCRRPEIFSNLATIILDEIHLLDNTYRGDQLRILLKRLKKVVNGHFATHILSATLANPDQIALRYIQEFEVVIVQGQRELEWRFVKSPEEICALAKSQGWKKLLVFCNYRKTVEKMGAEFEQLWKPYPVVVHHGALGRDIREEAETVMKEAHAAICVATSTLEIGIDIGNIDLVVLAQIPFGLSSLIQRIGRGNRRKNIIQVAVISDSPEEIEVMEKMFSSIKTGELPISEYKPDLSVVVQQTISYLFQHREGVKEEELVELHSIMCSQENLILILDQLQKKEWIEWRGGRWFATTKLMDEGEKGRIHSNISDSQSYTVIDANSGDTVGTVAGTFDDTFSLGRRTWKINSVQGSTIYVHGHEGIGSAPIFRRSHQKGAFAYLLPSNLFIDK